MNLIGIYMLTIIQYILSLSIIELIFHTIFSYYIVLIFRFSIYFIWNMIKQLIPLNDILKKYSSNNEQCWAVITGATDGIGLGFAEVLTQLGFDVCLVSRNQEKLNLTVKNLQKIKPEKYKQRKIMTVQFDFNDSGDQVKFQQLVKKLKKLNIGILVNNVGTSIVQQFEKITYDQLKDIININCTSMSALSGALIPLLKSRVSKSAIINLSSFAGQFPLPYITLYSATKAMNNTFSQGISMQNPNIDILAVRPMYVQSPLSRKKKGFNIPDRKQCALACLKQLRWEYQTNGYWMHRIFAEITRLFVPKWIIQIVANKVVKKVMEKDQMIKKEKKQ